MKAIPIMSSHVTRADGSTSTHPGMSIHPLPQHGDPCGVQSGVLSRNGTWDLMLTRYPSWSGAHPKTKRDGLPNTVHAPAVHIEQQVMH